MHGGQRAGIAFGIHPFKPVTAYPSIRSHTRKFVPISHKKRVCGAVRPHDREPLIILGAAGVVSGKIELVGVGKPERKRKLQRNQFSLTIDESRRGYSKRRRP